MDATTLLGLLAGGLTTACWAPQLVRSMRTRSLDDLSWAYLVVLDTGIALWLGYGLLTGDPAIIAANAVTLVAVLALTGLKWRGAVTTPRAEPTPPPAGDAAGPVAVTVGSACTTCLTPIVPGGIGERSPDRGMVGPSPT